MKIVNQGDLYSSAAAVVDEILEVLKAQGTLVEDAWLLLHEIFRGAAYGQKVLVGGEERDLERYCREKILQCLDLIDAAVDGLANEAFSYAALLLGSMGEYSGKVIPILTRQLSVRDVRRVAVARDAIEVAMELGSENRGNEKST